MKVKLNCVYETEKKIHQPGDTPDLPKAEADRLLSLGYASEIDKPRPAVQKEEGGEQGNGQGDAQGEG